MPLINVKVIEGVFRTDYAGTTLRDHLGLATPTAREPAVAAQDAS